MGNNLSKWQGLDLDALERIDKQVEEMSSNIWLSLEQGDTIVRFLPAPAGTDPFRITSIHYVDAIPGLDKTLVFACPRVELKQPCPACREADRLLATKNPIDKERAHRISGQIRVYANVVDRNAMENGPKIFGMGPMIWKFLKAIRANARSGGDFTDPTAAGFDIIVNRTGTGMQTRYTVSAERNNTPLCENADEMEDILNRQHNLDAQVDATVPEELLQAWQAMASAGRQPMRTRNAVADAHGETVKKPATKETDPDDPENW